ncbi:hypothetical protein DV738_g2852, partial [Chaetothyriales sp. CBS 135597]
MADHVDDNAVAQFVAITGAPSRQAHQFLAASDGDIETAVSNYYAAQEDHTEDHANDPTFSPPRHRRRQTTRRRAIRLLFRIATLGDLGGNRDDDSDDDEKQDFFAGGEKSGLAVQNPQDDLKKRILEKAQRRGPPPKEPTQKRSFFTGSARTLGGDDAPSQEIPAAPQPRQAERVERTLHFWRDGFSVDDGDLYRNDDPRNAQLLQLIQQGRAPLSIMNVAPGQEVDVELKQHDENYVRPKKKYKPFDGQGNRLGSPTPGLQSSPHRVPGAFEAAPASRSPSTGSTAPQPASVEVDESQPTLTLRVSLGSGTRVTSRFNASHTVGDVYEFVRQQEPGGREFVLQTIFPTIELKDKSQVLGDMAEFKRGGAVVQKYI